MGNGLHSTIEPLKSCLTKRWCPKWHEAFRAQSLGGYYERLNRNFKPVFTGQRRLVSQCRQLSIYAHLTATGNSSCSNGLRNDFEFIVQKYHDAQTGHWWFSLDDMAKVKDRYSDLYALSFVIFSFSHYYRATKDERSTIYALQVLGLINEHFRLSNLPGFAEAIGEDFKPLPKMRRQNPHMHLLEACLFAYDTWGNADYLKMADELVDLFYDYFYQVGFSNVCEFFNEDLTPHAEEGRKIEPGHSFEWVWLLKKHAAAHQDKDRHDATALALLEWANRFGWDDVHGGIYDVVGPSGAVLADTKRIWPFCEAMKANALMVSAASDRQAIKDRMAEMVRVFKTRYMDERGFWTEWLTRDLQSVTDYMPATTPYHVYYGIMETSDILEERGGSKSLFTGLRARAYALRRDLSLGVRAIKSSLRGRH